MNRGNDPYGQDGMKTSNRNDDIADSDVDFKTDFPVGEGAIYTG
jgi:hypothetical protein